MKIKDIFTIPLKANFKSPSKFGLGIRTYSLNVLVKIVSDGGIIGYGEACPVPIFSSETNQSIIEAIEKYIKPAIINKDPLKIAYLNDLMDKAIDGNNFAKSAVDIAIHDLVGKALKVPVHVLIGGKKRDQVEVNDSVTFGSSEEMAQKSKEIVEKGYNYIKIYGGRGTLNDDINHLEAIRKQIGYEKKLYLEINQQWKMSEALIAINKLQKYDLLFIEQPLSKWDLRGLKEISNRSTIPIALDESVHSLSSVFQIASERISDIINLYVQKTGGIYRTHQATSIIESSGIQCFMGSLLELGVATAAAIHLASTIKNLKYPCYLIGPERYTQEILQSPLLIKNGFIEIPEGAGLGIELNEKIIDKMRL